MSININGIPRTYRSVHDGCLQHAQGHQEPSPEHMLEFSRRAVSWLRSAQLEMRVRRGEIDRLIVA